MRQLSDDLKTRLARANIDPVMLLEAINKDKKTRGKSTPKAKSKPLKTKSRYIQRVETCRLCEWTQTTYLYQETKEFRSLKRGVHMESQTHQISPTGLDVIWNQDNLTFSTCPHCTTRLGDMGHDALVEKMIHIANLQRFYEYDLDKSMVK